jgi:UDP-N-acetylglucosamine 2-epimerase (non-hydrolysing)
LRKEGVPESAIEFVGNIMIDTLEAHRARAQDLDPCEIVDTALFDGQPALARDQERALTDGRFAAMTLHRPTNVDDLAVLSAIMDFLVREVAADMPLVWPVHPRAMKQMQASGLWNSALACGNLLLVRPLGYHDLLRLNIGAAIMLTDSGGLQEECCVLGTPCLTLRCNTERPITLREHGGASVLVGNNVENIRAAYRETLAMNRTPSRPEFWDGKTAVRILSALLKR